MGPKRVGRWLNSVSGSLGVVSKRPLAGARRPQRPPMPYPRILDYWQGNDSLDPGATRRRSSTGDSFPNGQFR
jgi:hypothetical protein